MELKHVERLTVSAANLRGKGKADIANILPSIRARGILEPLIVRPNGQPPCDDEISCTEHTGHGSAIAEDAAPSDTFEIVAGKRRGEIDALPCALLDEADDGRRPRSLIDRECRASRERFVPKWTVFPPGAYPERGGVGTVSRAGLVEHLLARARNKDSSPKHPAQSDGQPAVRVSEARIEAKSEPTDRSEKLAKVA